MIQRVQALKIAERKLKSNPALGILGPRQIGKTTLARAIMEGREAVYLDLESPSDVIRLTDAENFLLSQSEKLIVIDEVQRMPELFPILRSVIDRNRKNGKFILLGSASPHLLARSSETLAGRISFWNFSRLISWKSLSMISLPNFGCGEVSRGFILTAPMKRVLKTASIL